MVFPKTPSLSALLSGRLPIALQFPLSLKQDGSASLATCMGVNHGKRVHFEWGTLVQIVPIFSSKSSAVAEMGVRLATIDMGRKLGAVLLFLGGGTGHPSNNIVWAEAYLLPSGILIHLAVWPQ